jgi:hypothetical protein
VKPLIRTLALILMAMAIFLSVALFVPAMFIGLGALVVAFIAGKTLFGDDPLLWLAFWPIFLTHRLLATPFFQDAIP